MLNKTIVNISKQKHCSIGELIVNSAIIIKAGADQRTMSQGGKQKSLDLFSNCLGHFDIIYIIM